MGRPRLHDEHTAEALLDAAEAIAAAGGPDALSVRRVADLAGTTTRAVYTVFESKDGLLAALGNRGFEMLAYREAELSMTDDPAADLVNGAVSAFRPWALQHPALFRIAFQLSDIPPDLAERFRPSRVRALGNLVELISRALGLQGGLTNPDVFEATVKFDALCEGMALLELRTGLPADRAEQIWRDAVTALVAGMQQAATHS